MNKLIKVKLMKEQIIEWMHGQTKWMDKQTNFPIK